MGFSRISTSFPTDLSLFFLHKNQERTTQLQSMIATGQNIQKPSDDAIGMNRLLRNKLDLSRDMQFQRNLNTAISELNVNENVLNGVTDVIQRARELAVQASSQTNGPNDLLAIQEEVDALIQTTFQLANTTYLGRYTFAGFRTDTPAFTQSGLDVTYAGTANTVPFQRQIEVADGITIPVNFNGQDVFGSVAVVAGNPVGSGLFNTLRKMSLDLQNANYTGLNQDVALLATDLENVTSIRAEVGARVNQAEALLQLNENRQITFTEQIADVQDVDLPTVISQLAQHDQQYQTSLASLSRILSTSLVNFLR
ncbi:MAG: flagellar hook-associated protein FlgL [Cyanobacteria bacterium HKST-UBA06]|nr:flagellar hook-associated protein FlgL [Cyanobacteria bacterium HKST-UBA05]MCA9799385.1 flagellar hook-associated protein FlgL [Cyanobacteria bacterium HKST-UBA04]MCA9807200.1 flagellar hook-associated protein FlgL [Cyanobacteria bacterium HKST-UBA06]MCA9841037.1 flagellar hook-associated protein FlgL [Cyanobacteria bacterium HKST-UBA03]